MFLTEEAKKRLDIMMDSFKLSSILDHLAASTFEAADSCDGDSRDALMQQAACISAAALFSKQWCE